MPANNTVPLTQLQGGIYVNRLITPVANGYLGFNADSKLVNKGGLTVKQVSFVEDATSLTHTASILMPPGATLVEIQVDAGVLWTATTSATLKVGDVQDDDGYFIGVNLKATDLLVGEQLRMSQSTLWGGKEGAYLNATTGRRGPAGANSGGKYTSGSSILATITVVGPATTAGRTYVSVYYSQGDVVAPVLA